MVIIYLGSILLQNSSGLPGNQQSEQLCIPMKTISLFDLASGVVYLASCVTTGMVGSYPAFSPLSGKSRKVYFLWHFQYSA